MEQILQSLMTKYIKKPTEETRTELVRLLAESSNQVGPKLIVEIMGRLAEIGPVYIEEDIQLLMKIKLLLDGDEN